MSSPNLDLIWPKTNSKRFPFGPFWRKTKAYSKNFLVEWEESKYWADLRNGLSPPYNELQIVYDINADGFRCIEFDEVPAGAMRVVSVGCSNTEGYGLPEHHTWPYLICKKLETLSGGPVVNFNLGVSAASNRTIALRAVHAMSRLAPDVVIVGWTFSSRVLFVAEDGSPRDWSVPNSFETQSTDSVDQPKLDYYALIQNPMWDLHNWMVDIMMVEMAAALANKNVLHLFNWASEEETKVLRRKTSGVFDKRPTDKMARDLMHPGFAYNTWLADRIYEAYTGKAQ